MLSCHLCCIAISVKLKGRLDSLYALKCPHKYPNTHKSVIGILLRSIVEVSIQNIIESRSNAFYFDSFVAISYCRALHQPGHSTSSELTAPCPPPPPPPQILGRLDAGACPAAGARLYQTRSVPNAHLRQKGRQQVSLGEGGEPWRGNRGLWLDVWREVCRKA